MVPMPMCLPGEAMFSFLYSRILSNYLLPKVQYARAQSAATSGCESAILQA